MKKRPFSCGSQYSDWTDKNCLTCKKGKKDLKTQEYECDIEESLLFAYFDDGTVPEDIFYRMGASSEKLKYIWNCPEKDNESNS